MGPRASAAATPCSVPSGSVGQSCARICQKPLIALAATAIQSNRTGSAFTVSSAIGTASASKNEPRSTMLPCVRKSLAYRW